MARSISVRRGLTFRQVLIFKAGDLAVDVPRGFFQILQRAVSFETGPPQVLDGVAGAEVEVLGDLDTLDTAATLATCRMASVVSGWFTGSCQGPTLFIRVYSVAVQKPLPVDAAPDGCGLPEGHQVGDLDVQRVGQRGQGVQRDAPLAGVLQGINPVLRETDVGRHGFLVQP